MKWNFTLGFIIIVSLIGFQAYTYAKAEKAESRLASIENQIKQLSATLQDSSMVSEENKRDLQELSNRGQMVAKSQDEFLTSAVSEASPSVVSIVVSKAVPQLQVEYVNPFGNDPFFRGFGFQTPVWKQVGTKKEQVGAGTGFFVKSDGYIVTNKHVVDDIEAEYTALLSTGEKKSAKVIYRDDKNDVALIKIDGNNYKSLNLGNSSELKIGQTVVAIGNALGEYNNSVSVGIISGLNRKIEAQGSNGFAETLTGVIQTDAAINPGNSGGPLLDLDGRAIGVNVAMRGGASNIAFSIPINEVKAIISRFLI